MREINRRNFLRTTGKLALAGVTAFSFEPVLRGLIFDQNRLASAAASQTELNVYNDVNPNAKDIVAHTFKYCLERKWLPRFVIGHPNRWSLWLAALWLKLLRSKTTQEIKFMHPPLKGIFCGSCHGAGSATAPLTKPQQGKTKSE